MTPKKVADPLKPVLELLAREKEIAEQAFELRVEIGEQLRTARTAKGLSQPRLARLSRVRQAEISQIERGIIWRPHLVRQMADAIAAYVAPTMSVAS